MHSSKIPEYLHNWFFQSAPLWSHYFSQCTEHLSQKILKSSNIKTQNSYFTQWNLVSHLSELFLLKNRFCWTPHLSNNYAIMNHKQTHYHLFDITVSYIYRCNSKALHNHYREGVIGVQWLKVLSFHCKAHTQHSFYYPLFLCSRFSKVLLPKPSWIYF